MKLLAFDRKSSCWVEGKTYVPDGNGLIDVPDSMVGIFESHGFTREINPVALEPTPAVTVQPTLLKPAASPAVAAIAAKKK